MIKVVNFSTFIDVLSNSKNGVTHALCKLYDLKDDKGYYRLQVQKKEMWQKMRPFQVLCKLKKLT